MTLENSLSLPKQFAIVENAPDLPGQWNKVVLGAWTIVSAEKVPIVKVVAPSGQVAGYLIGWAISAGMLLEHGDSITVGAIRKWEAELCGRYVFLEQEDEKTTLTLDAGGLLPVVYHTKKRILASTPAMMGLISDVEEDVSLIDVFQIPQKNGWYPFGLTPYLNVARIMPGQIFDMQNWAPQRFWPMQSFGAVELDKKELVCDIANLVVRNVGAIVGRGSGVAHLTAGYDSRMILAACRPYVDNCQFETVRRPDQSTELDCFIANAMAEKFALRHEFLEYTESSQTEIAEWMGRTSNCVHDAVTYLGATMSRYDRKCHSITGTCGEVGRAYYWADPYTELGRINPDMLLAAMKIPNTQRIRELAGGWLDSLPVERPSLVWDLAYIEQRLGGWAGPSVYGHDIEYPTLSPFNSRVIYEKMVSLPEKYRQTNQFARDYISYLWPELLEFPFNRAMGLQRLKFFKSEIRDMLPPKVRKFVKSLM
ncbi:MAG: hypothetical protein ABJN40_21010 [Sneathiella sp.]